MLPTRNCSKRYRLIRLTILKVISQFIYVNWRAQNVVRLFGTIRSPVTVTAIVCVVGALLGLLISSRSTHAEEPELLEEPSLAPRV